MSIRSTTSERARAVGPTRRGFMRLMGQLGLGAALQPVVSKALGTFGACGGSGLARAAGPGRVTVEARYFTRIPGTDKVRCDLCPRREVLEPGQRGYCLTRRNLGGTLVTDAYNRPCVLNVDPIGENPLSNFHPGMKALSIAHAGCNLHCAYCQNWQVVFNSPSSTRNIRKFDSRRLVDKMLSAEIGGVSFTYSEPACSPEFVADLAEYCGQSGLKRALCTAGYVEPGPFRDLLRHIDAVTITYKGPTDAFYRQVARATLKPVLDSMSLARAEGKWLEIATLVVPTYNDDRRSLAAMARWIQRNLGSDTPWHLERFEPEYQLRGLPPTPRQTLETARRIGLDAGLRYVYISNFAPHPANHTYCPSCGRVVVRRMGFEVLENHMVGDACPHCETTIAGVWS